MPLLVPVVVFVLYLVDCSLFRGLSSGVILALQANDGVQLGVDNLGVVRHVGRLLDGSVGSRPAELVKDGTVRSTTVKGLADDALVRAGGARELDRLGNDGADEAADFGRSARWRPVVLSLHRFFIAIARAVVNHDGEAGTSMNPMVWSVGSVPKWRKVAHAVRDRASLPGLAGICGGVGRCCCHSYCLSRY